MKTFNYNGRLLEYKVYLDFFWDEGTRIYEGYEIIKRKKYLFFGDVITVKKPKFLFSISIDIEDSKYSKETIKSVIDYEFIKIKRKEEIEKGQII